MKLYNFRLVVVISMSCSQILKSCTLTLVITCCISKCCSTIIFCMICSKICRSCSYIKICSVCCALKSYSSWIRSTVYIYKTKYIFLSTRKVYKSKANIVENSELFPKTNYSKNKLISENKLTFIKMYRVYTHAHNRIFRLFPGPGRRFTPPPTRFYNALYIL